MYLLPYPPVAPLTKVCRLYELRSALLTHQERIAKANETSATVLKGGTPLLNPTLQTLQQSMHHDKAARSRSQGLSYPIFSFSGLRAKCAIDTLCTPAAEEDHLERLRPLAIHRRSSCGVHG